MRCPCPGTTARVAPWREAVPWHPRTSVKASALLVDVAPHADFLAALQPPSEVALAFSNLTPLAAAPECLLSLEEALEPAPDLVGTPRAVHSIAQGPGARLLSPSNSAKMEAAACLASPVMVEESAADIIRAAAAELRLEQQAQIRMRYAEEVQELVRKRVWGSETQPRSTRRRASLDERPEASQAISQLLEAHTHKNRLELGVAALLPSPVEGMILEEPDHASLLASCVASLDYTTEQA